VYRGVFYVQIGCGRGPIAAQFDEVHYNRAMCIRYLRSPRTPFSNDFMVYRAIFAGAAYEMVHSIFKANKRVMTLIAKAILSYNMHKVGMGRVKVGVGKVKPLESQMGKLYSREEHVTRCKCRRCTGNT